MTTVQIVGLAAAAAVVLWPQLHYAATWLAVAASSLLRREPGPEPAKPAAIAPNFRDAVAHLAQVRLRLLTTEALGDEQKKAIETLTLALVAGSDK